MFNFFKRKDRLTEVDLTFLKAVVMSLPDSYRYLSNQISKDFILNKKRNELGEEGTYRLVLNAELEDKYADKQKPDFFILKDIFVWDKAKQEYEYIELHIMQGMLVGFQLKSSYSELDLSRIDLKSLKEKHFVDEDKIELKRMIGEIPRTTEDVLDIESTFRIEIPEGKFYVIKDLGDGNYLAMGEDGGIYGLIHDPYQIDKLFDDFKEFDKALNTNAFSIEEYYDRKMS